MKTPKGDRELLRKQNRGLVIHLLRTAGALSRTEIAERTGLAPSAMTRMIRDLLAEGIVVEAGKISSRGGRRAVLIALNPDYAHTIAVKIERTCLIAASVDLSGTIRQRGERRYAAPPTPDQAIEGIVSLSQEMLRERTLGIGVCVSGFIEPESGRNLFTPVLGWEDVPLKEPLAQRLAPPVRVENDVNALALAERWYGAGRGYRHFICMTVGEGIGAGVVLDGDLYRGAFGGAGELGHITIDPEGPLCRCRERGCLEVYASDAFLAAAAEDLAFSGIPAMADSARNGSVEAREVFASMGRSLGLGAKNLVNLLNPEAIVLGGERMDSADLFLPAFEEVVCRHSFPSEAARLEIVPAELGADGFLIGAATLAAADFFYVPVRGRSQ